MTSTYIRNIGQRAGTMVIIETPPGKGLGLKVVARCVHCGYEQEMLAAGFGVDRNMCRVQHGETGTHLYNVWQSMKKRCYSPKGVYAGNHVCDQWRECYLSFRDWSLANGYDRNKVFHRTSDFKQAGFAPHTCKWGTTDEAAQGRRPSTGRPAKP